MKELVTVRKDNQLIQNNRFTLSLQEQRIILFLLSKIKPWHTDLEEYRFSVAEFARICGMDHEVGGKTYNEIKAIIKGLRDKSMWLELEDGTETVVSWIQKARIEKKHQAIRIQLDPDLKPYLIDLQRCYTEYELIYALNFSSKYSIRLYELSKSIHGKKLVSTEIKYNLAAFREKLGVPNTEYPMYSNLRQRVIEPAIKEINENSDIQIEVVPLKAGRKVVAIKLIVANKPAVEMLEVHQRLTERRKET